jgi:hypothetical protein
VWWNLAWTIARKLVWQNLASSIARKPVWQNQAQTVAESLPKTIPAGPPR